MSIGASVASWVGTVAAEAYINGRRVFPSSGTIDLGFDIISSSATLVLPEDPGFIEHWHSLEIRLGWDGRTLTVFRGVVQDTDPHYGADGFEYQVVGAGQLIRTQMRTFYDDEISYDALEDEVIVDAVLTEAGVGSRSIEGDSIILGVVRSVTLSTGDVPWNLINEIDQVTGYKTWDGPDGVVRRRKISGNPSSSFSIHYQEGVNIQTVGRRRTIRGISNAVEVVGLTQDAIIPTSTRLAPNPLVPTPPTYVMFEFQSDLIEDGDLADIVSERLLIENNRQVEEVPLVIKGDPRRVPGETVKVTSAKLGISSGGNFWVKHVTHTFGSDGYTTTLTLEGGIGSTAPTENIPPVAQFTYLVTRETWLVSGTPTDFYTVTCDGSTSYDPDTEDGAIATYSWVNNKNSDVSATPYYATAFTAAQMAATPTITLTVEDSLAADGVLTQTIVAPQNALLVRDLYVAAGSRAEATNNGGKDWQTWTPGAGTVISTPAIAGQDHSYFGLSDGKLYHTDDYLDTAPTLVHDFGSQINAIWIHEGNADRVTVGLNNGEIHNTTNASALGSSTWNLLYTAGAAVLDVVESGAVAGQYRVSTGATVIITYNEFATVATLITFPATARQIIPSIIGLPGKATGTGSGPVRSEDGTTYTYATTAPTDVHAGTHHIRQAILLVVDRTGKVWVTEDAGTEFTNIATLTGGDPANRAIRDGDNQMIFYVAADDGLYKSYDGGLTWKLLRDYAGGSLFGRQIGYGGIRPAAITPLTLVTDTSWLAKTLWNGSSNDPLPAGWTTLAFDDSAWTAAVVATPAPSVSYGIPSGADIIWEDDRPESATEQVLLRKEFTVSDGAVSLATLSINADDAMQVYLNEVIVFSETFDTDPPTGAELGLVTVHLDPALILTGQANIIAVRGVNYFPGFPIGSQYAFFTARLELE